LLAFVGKRRYGTILADPPWQFTNKTGKIAPEHRRLTRYGTMRLDEIMALPVEQLALPTAHLYLWCPNALLPEGLAVMQAGGSPTNPTSCGTRCARMAGRTDAAWAFTSVM
jgi:N6-adenosine-specific RNA methylase IME4